MRTTLCTPWTSQPQTPVKVKPEWLSVFLPFGPTGFDVVLQKPNPAAVSGSAFSKSVTGGGVALSPDAVTAGAGFQVDLGATKVITLVLAGQMTGSSGRIFWSSNYEILPSTTTSFGIYIAGTLVWTATWSSPVKKSIALSHDWSNASNAPVVYVDGVAATIASITGPGTGSSTSTALIGNHLTLNRPFVGTINAAALSLSPTSASKLKAYSENPWQLFQPISRTLWVPAAAGGGTTYTMSPGGTITLSGSSNQLRTRLQVPSGNITFSGTVPLLRTRLQTTSGSIVFGGTAPFSQQNTYTLSPGGTITFSGTGNQVRERIQIPTGNITFSGTNVTQHIRTLVPTGSIDFSGSATETRIRILAPTGQITFLGSAPLINPNAVGGVTTWRTLTGMGN